MSARTTRLLVLGAVRRLGPATGYDVQSALFAMSADRWAGLRSGSIYAMLTSLTRQTRIQPDPVDPSRHRVTAEGRTAHDAWVLDGLRTLPQTGDTVELRAALQFADLLDPGAVRGALMDRLDAIEGALADIELRIRAAAPSERSPYVTSGAGLEHAVLAAQADWLRELLGHQRACVRGANGSAATGSADAPPQDARRAGAGRAPGRSSAVVPLEGGEEAAQQTRQRRRLLPRERSDQPGLAAQQ